MKLLRHVLSHLTLLFILFGLVSLYYYRHQILPDSITEEVDMFAEKIHPKLNAFARVIKKEPIEEESTVAVVEAQDEKTHAALDTQESIESSEISDNVPVAENETNDVIQTGGVAIVVEDASTNEALAAIPQETAISNAAAGEQQDAAETIVQPENVIQPESDSTENTKSVSTDSENSSTEDLLRAARIAFNQGDLATSVNAYKSLIELNNDEADFYGELGNVYYAQGNWSEAGLAYYEAATRLIEQKQLAQVSYLQRVIQGLDAERAEKLANELTEIY